MYFVYIVRCRDGSLYTGTAADLRRRMHAHTQQTAACARYTRSQPVAALEAGIHIRDADGEFDARPAKLRRDGGDAAYIRVTEGKYHQVKRMFAARGKPVIYLKRMAIGSLMLDPALAPGEWRELTDDEVVQLEQSDDGERVVETWGTTGVSPQTPQGN